MPDALATVLVSTPDQYRVEVFCINKHFTTSTELSKPIVCCKHEGLHAALPLCIDTSGYKKKAPRKKACCRTCTYHLHKTVLFACSEFLQSHCFESAIDIRHLLDHCAFNRHVTQPLVPPLISGNNVRSLTWNKRIHYDFCGATQESLQHDNCQWKGLPRATA